MRIALVHDDLIQNGGAENLLLALHKIYPNAPVYTSIASKSWHQKCKDNHIKLRTSFMQRLPFAVKLNRYYSPFLMHALSFQSFDFSQYDVVISVSARYAHGIITKPKTAHIVYFNSPGRMFWEPTDYFRSESYGLLSPLKSLARSFLSLPLSHLRKWDFISAQRPDYLIANAKTPQARIIKYYKRSSHIIYPFVDFARFNTTKKTIGNYYVVLTRLVSWKNVEIAVRACNELSHPLIIIGEGPDRSRLEGLAKSNIRFTGFISNKEKTELLSGAKALINTQKEDFGIVSLEAQACGTPVIAFGKGGVLETVIPGITGEFFMLQTANSLKSILKSFDPSKYEAHLCKDNAKKFDLPVFEKNIRDYIQCVFEESQMSRKMIKS